MNSCQVRELRGLGVGTEAEQEPRGQGTVFIWCNDVKGEAKDTLNQAFQPSGSKVRLLKNFYIFVVLGIEPRTLYTQRQAFHIEP